MVQRLRRVSCTVAPDGGAACAVAPDVPCAGTCRPLEAHIPALLDRLSDCMGHD
jgi:hypothetical protein